MWSNSQGAHPSNGGSDIGAGTAVFGIRLASPLLTAMRPAAVPLDGRWADAR